MEQVRGKFLVSNVTRTEHSGGYNQVTVNLTAVYGGDKNSEDNTYASATPSGNITLTITNEAAQAFFKPGEKIYVDFTKAAE